MKLICLKVLEYLAIILFKSRVYITTHQFLGIVDNLLLHLCVNNKLHIVTFYYFFF